MNSPKVKPVIALREDEAKSRKLMMARKKEQELSEAKAKKAQAAKIAAKETKEAKSFLSIIRIADQEGTLIDNAVADDDLLRIRVTSMWHQQHYQDRLQLAQSMQKTWARIHSAEAPDTARIKIEDYNGNEVGGSRFFAGSIIWVSKYE